MTTVQVNLKFLEYWGIMDAEYAREVGMELPDEVDDLDEVQVNAWVSNGKLLRGVVNPFTPYRLPYNAFPYERNPYSFLWYWGCGEYGRFSTNNEWSCTYGY